MRIGVDFGTSFSSAAVCKDGKVELITFGNAQQFRTAVFFPDRYVDPSQFSLTAENEREIDNAIRLHKSRYSELLAQYEASLSSLVRDEKRKQREGSPYTEQQKANRRALLVKPRRLSDDDIRQAALNSIRRRWVSMQRESVAQEGLDVRQASGVFGEDAIDALYNNELGRIFQSPKSMLGYKLEPRLQDVVVGVVTQILAHIRAVAQQQLGVEVNAVVLGRPVVFRGLLGSNDDQAPQALLERAAREAGFSDVAFLMEPSAAAFGYHRQSASSCQALIIDIGGGTTDVAYAQVGGGTAKPVIHKVWGRGYGGSDVDVELSVRVAMPLFGKEDPQGLPLHAYRSAAKVSDLNLQRAFVAQPITRVGEPYSSRLQVLKEKGTTVRLNRDVERLKIDLSDERSASLTLDYIEPGLSTHVELSALEASAQSFVDRLRALLEEVRNELPEANPAIFMTGGMSRAPYVQACVREIFSQSDIVMGDASLGVVTGLAQFASPPDAVVPASAGPEKTKTSSDEVARMALSRELFERAMARADQIAAAYRLRVEHFERLLEVQEALFANTDAGDYLKLLSENVQSAYEVNQQAGWLPESTKFTTLEYFETLIRHDRRARRYKALADVPAFLRQNFEGDDDHDFQHYANELREACWSAYDEMPELQEIMDDEPVPDDFFDALYSWPEDAGASKREIKQGRALVDNLHEGWKSCQKAGLGLLHMANHEDDDYDASLMEALLDA